MEWSFPWDYRNKKVEERASRFPPVFSEEKAVSLAESLGAEVLFERLKKLRGGVFFRKGRSYIVVNQNLPQRERAKTILHEVGHLLLHHAHYLRPVFLDHEIFVGGLEKEADYFAYLLMREWMKEWEE
jgi:Zn-dependent peptidase ImmA (M78 family)